MRKLTGSLCGVWGFDELSQVYFDIAPRKCMDIYRHEAGGNAGRQIKKAIRCDREGRVIRGGGGGSAVGANWGSAGNRSPIPKGRGGRKHSYLVVIPPVSRSCNRRLGLTKRGGTPLYATGRAFELKTNQ